MDRQPCPVDPFGSGVHSDDRIAVYCGSTQPVMLCGYHATYWPEFCRNGGGPTVPHYRVVGSPFYRPAQLALAKPYARLEDALADMGDGLVIAEDGHIAAFHERHERVLCQRAERQVTR